MAVGEPKRKSRSKTRGASGLGLFLGIMLLIVGALFAIGIASEPAAAWGMFACWFWASFLFVAENVQNLLAKIVDRLPEREE